MHKCDNRLCVNPKHLTLGTYVLNMKQMRDRGRGYVLPVGENSHVAKITDKQIEAAKEAAGRGVSYQVIAQQLAVHQSHVSRIVRGLSRKTAGGESIKRLRRKPLDQKTGHAILFLHGCGFGQFAIAQQLNVSRGAVQRTIQRHIQQKHPEYAT